MKRLYIIIVIVSTHLFPAFAQQETGELSHFLDTVDVVAVSNAASVRTMSDGGVSINMDLLDRLPKIMGNADPINYSRMLPGVQTSGEYNGGLHINGSENSHNLISVLDVPIYNVNHLLGFFSTFIPSHYGSMSLYKTPHSAGAPNRLGGELLFRPDYELQEEKLSGSISSGLISSQGTLKVLTGKKSVLTASLRGSYINLLYSSWLDIDGSELRYSFFDSNLTWACNVNENNTVLADAYWGQDRASVFESGFSADIGCRWGNDAEAIHWIHDGLNGFRMKHTLYHSSYANRFFLDHDMAQVDMPSGIGDWGYKGALGWKGLDFGADVLYHYMTLQSPVVTGTYNNTDMDVVNKDAWEYSVFSDYSFNIGGLNAKLGLRGNQFQSGREQFRSLDPSLQVAYYGDGDRWSVSASIAQRHQYLFQTGLTESSLPTEFWMPADADYKPQYMRGVTLTGMVELMDGEYTLNASASYKRLYNQLEYYGSIIDFLASDYSASEHLLCGDGYNYGLDIMLSRNTGNLTGWISYSFGRAMRRFDREGMDGWYHASHERLHELDMVAVYETGRRWKPSMTLVAAGGTPFTAPEYFYLLNRNLFVKYGEFNANRLNPYIRMDLSVNYDLKTGKGRFLKSQGLNLSLYNVLCRGNDLAYRVKVYDNKFYYHHVTFMTVVLPSISYYCSF